MTDQTLRVSVTGGAGFIGRHICTRLGDRGGLESIIDLRASRDEGLRGRQILGDVRDPEALRIAFRGANAVMHLAAAHHDFGIDDATYFSVNEGGARQICRVMDELGIRKLCFMSSVAVYGSGYTCPDETTECRPETTYGQSKLAAEEVLREWAIQGEDRSVLVIRPTVTFGAGHFANMYTLIRQIASRLYVAVGPGQNRKSLVYVDNLVDATLSLWARNDPPAFDVYNVVDKPDLSSRAIAEVVHRALRRPPPAIKVPTWAALMAAKPFDAVIALTGRNLPISSNRVRKFVEANTTYAADKLARSGFRPSVTLEEGIQRMVRWYQEEGRSLPVDRSIPPADVVPLTSS